MSFFYHMHGLYYESDIKLYEHNDLIIQNHQRSDVTIKLSDHFLPEFEKYKDKNFIFSNSRIKFKTEICAFLIEEGTRIYFAPLKETSNYMLSAYIIGWCMCYLMYQRNKLGIHCSALSYKDQAFLVSGNSGAGKSTTAMSLAKKGYKFLTDDLAFISSDNDFIIYPALPLQKICSDKIGTIKNKENLIFIDELKGKYALIDKKSFDDSPKKVTTLFKLETSKAITKVKHDLITGFQSLSLLLDSLYMVSFFRETSFPVSVKSECLKLASKIRVINIQRPLGLDTTDEITDIIENYLEEKWQQ